MDAADAWLREHDPHYSQSRQAWPDIADDGEYYSPWREIPCGNEADIALLVELGEGRYVEEAEKLMCRACGLLFYPTRIGHHYCSDHCRNVAHQRSSRAAYMRQYRRRQNRT